MAGRVTHRLAGVVSTPTVDTVALLVWMYVVQVAVGYLGIGLDAFVLRLPVRTRPWTLITTVYAHAGPVHLLTNLLVVVLVGVFIEDRITRLGYHALFLSAGTLAATSVVVVGAAAGFAVSAVGASGAVFALVGYAVIAPPRHQSSQADHRKGTSTGDARRRFGDPYDRRHPRRGGTPRILLFIFGILMVFGPLAATVSPLDVVGHVTGFLIGLLVGGAAWTYRTEV